MRGILIATLLFAAACSAGARVGAGARPEALAYVVDDTRTADATVHELTVLPDAAFEALEVVFSSLGFEPYASDPATRVIAIQEHRLGQRLAGEPIRRFFSCGEGPAGRVVDRSRVTLAIQSALQDPGNGTVFLRTATSVIAEPRDGTQAARRCSTTRELEILIADRILTAAERGGPDDASRPSAPPSSWPAS